MMRRLLMWLLFAVVLLGLTNSASAGWRYVGRHIGHFGHHGRHFGHYGHTRHHGHFGHPWHLGRSWHVGHSWNRWAYRPFVHHGFVGVRHFHRVPVFRSYGFHGNPWFGSVSGFITTPQVFYSPSVYQTFPFCASVEPVADNGFTDAYVRSKIIEFGRDTDTSAAASLLASYRRPSTSEVAELTGHARLLNYGDRLFRGAFYREALRKYDAAAELAPQSAEVQLRRGFALVATERYGEAAAAFKQGLLLDASYATTGIPVADMYGNPQAAAKTSHVDKLAAAALASEPNADLLFVIGLFLHGEGQAERATPFFRQAAELAGADAAHLQRFLPRAAAPSAPSQPLRIEPGDKLAATISIRGVHPAP